MSQPIGSAMDSLSAALKSNIIPNQEYLLQGSILDAAVEVLLHRLRGLCDNVDTGPETFHDHEMCFSIRKFLFYLLNLTHLFCRNHMNRRKVSCTTKIPMYVIRLYVCT
jgi:hypothetical protein